VPPRISAARMTRPNRSGSGEAWQRDVRDRGDERGELAPGPRSVATRREARLAGLRIVTGRLVDEQPRKRPRALCPKPLAPRPFAALRTRPARPEPHRRAPEDTPANTPSVPGRETSSSAPGRSGSRKSPPSSADHVADRRSGLTSLGRVRSNVRRTDRDPGPIWKTSSIRER